MKKVPFYLFFIIIFSVAAFGQVRQTENTVKLETGRTGQQATIADMSWLAGTWTGDALGGFSEEVWSRPNNGVMMGMYRLVKEGKPLFYEILTLAEKDGTLLIRLKHFDENLVGWEERDKTVDFRFVKKDGRRFYFEGMTFEPVGKNDLNIYLAIRQDDGSVREEIFRYKRVK